jgi:RalA-binding protein 1
MSSPQPNINYGQDEIPHLRSQNDQLWKIIEKQRVMIQNLQKDNVRLSAERDGLQDQVNSLEKEITRKQRVTSLLISPQALREIAEQDDAASTPSSETTPSPVEYNQNTFPTSPMPPPRSPYRPLKEKTEDFGLKMMEQEPESYIKSNFGSEDTNNMNGRSSPGSPAPGPHSPTSPRYQQQQQQQQQQYQQQQQHQLRKDSAPLPSTNRNHSPFIVPSPSKSSSSLEVRKARQRDSMMPPARAALEHDPTMRAASPPLPPSSSTFSLTRPINTTTTNNTNNTFNSTTNTSTNTISSNSSSTTTNNTIYRGKRESTIFSTSRTDLSYINDEESRQQEEYHHPASVASPDFTQTKKQTNTLMGSMANVCIKVVGSNIKPNDKGKEVVSFILSVGVYREEDGEFEERWRVEKLYSDFLSLDSKVKKKKKKILVMEEN